MEATSWRRQLHRWRWWIAVVALLIVVRVALPEVLRRVIVSQASEALHARVDVGDVDLRLWRGGVALEDVAVRERGAPEPPPPPDDAPEDAPPPVFDAYSPIIAFKRFAVEVRFLPLLSKTIQLRDIELERPRLAVDRLASGDFNVMALMPSQEVAVGAGASPGSTATPTPGTSSATEDGERWKFGLDRFELHDGRVRFRDMTLEGSEPIEVGIDRISVDEIALTPAVYGKPGRIALQLGVDQGTIDVTADLALNGTVVNVKTNVAAERLPLRRARLYVPKVGWSELQGELDLDLNYELEAKAKNDLSGTLALRDVAVSVPNLKDSAVGWRSLDVDLERIDLLNRRAAIRAVALDGAEVAIRPQGGALLPVLGQQKSAVPVSKSPTAAPTPTEVAAQAAVASAPPASPADSPDAATASPTSTSTPVPIATPTVVDSAGEPTATSSVGGGSAATPLPAGMERATDGKPTPTATPSSQTPRPDEKAPESSTKEAPAAPWGWQVATIKITNSKLRVLSEQAPLDVGVDVTTANLSGDPGSVGHVTLGLDIEPGTVALDGDLRIAPVPAFGGTLKIADLSLPALPVINSVLPPEAFPSGNLRSDLVITAGLPSSKDGEAPADRLRVAGTIGLAALSLSPPQAPGLTVELQDVALRIDQLAVPGVIPPGKEADAGDAIDLAAGLTLSQPHVMRTGEVPLDVGAESIGLEIPSLAVPAVLAGLGRGDGVSLVKGGFGLELTGSRVGLGSDDMAVEAQRLALQVTDATLPVVAPSAAAPAKVEPETEDTAPSPVTPPAAPIAAPPVTLALQLDLTEPKVATAQGKELNTTAESIALVLTDVVVPGFVAGAPPAPTLEPLQVKGNLELKRLRVARGDGKELSIGAQAIEVALQDLALPGVPGGIPPGSQAPPIYAAFGTIRLEAPAIRVTRRREGIVMPAVGAPAAEQAAAPTAPATEPQEKEAASSPLELQVAAFRLRHGELDFTDRAVEPAFSTRLAPIEIEARNIELPGPKVKPLQIDITSEDQGRITVQGDLEPDVSTLKLDVEGFALTPFNPYATTYSPYSIADGALTIETKAKASGGKYDVENHIRLHQFELGGTEGDSLFEESFGIPIGMALALLRDVQGNINLSVPLEVDRSGNAKVDVLGVVRSALRRAITGALTSPLKMLGAAIGGKGAPIAPSPIAFRLGRAEPTDAGAENAERLAAFLASRPAMGVQLSSAATKGDERWLHEQALLGDWADENFFERSLAFITKRGPRERIRAYLEARARNKRPELSAEDAATLDEWLAERPAPTEEQLQALADARLAAVEKALAEEGIEASRVTRGAPPEEPAKPIVRIRLRTAQAVASPTPSSTAGEPGTD